MTGDINRFMQEFAILAPPFLLALTLHELAHGYVAYRFGDPTAQRLGRLTMNPLKHLDPLGTILFFIMHIGWAKPVPVNPSYFQRPERDMLWVALAGPGANLLLAVASAVTLKLLPVIGALLPLFVLKPVLLMLAASTWINIMLAVFNLIPIPPLDGGKVMTGLLPPQLAHVYRRAEPFGFVLLLLLFYTGVIPKLIMPLISFAHSLLTG
ncbi:MAG: site-2 protease family protein [Desulfobulbaceae bacterium]|nr:site-2 protease family protein [Desulfobulbaceae bacterium]